MKNKDLNTGLEGYSPIKKVNTALRGLYYAVILDFSVAYKVFLSSILLVGFIYYRQWVDLTLILVSTGMVITSEIFNTAIESLCDFVESKENPKIGIIKDISAGAVGISIAIWFVVIIIDNL